MFIAILYFHVMIRFLFVALICCLSSASVLGNPEPAIAHQQKPQPDFYTSVTELLQQYVRNGQVKYKELQKDNLKLDRLARQVASFEVSKASPSERKAFYINAYNILVLKQVMEHYPLKSVMDIPGFFDRQKYKVAGEELTLNELENKKLRAPFKDARIHFALVCAAKSCPPLLNKAYTPQKVENQLETQTRLALQDPSFIRVLPQQRQVQVSEIFKWYEPDFLAEAESILSYINKYRAKPLPQQYKQGYYTYDWALNEVK